MKKGFKPITLLTAATILILIALIFFSTKGLNKECDALKYSGQVKDKINLVFLPDNYQDTSIFLTDVEEFSKSLLSLQPFVNHKDDFNICTVKEFKDLGCKDEGAIICDTRKVKRAASKCPNDFIIVLHRRSKIQDLVDPLRSAAYQQITSINTADDPLVLAHEFGHLLGDFAEEYIINQAEIDWDAPNCDKDKKECSKFSIVEDSGCFLGCTTHDYSRSIETGIMRDYWKGKTYGSYNEFILEEELKDKTQDNQDIKYSPIKRIQENEKPDNILILDLNIGNDTITIENKEIGKGYAPNIDKQGYSYFLKSEEGEILYNFNFGYLKIIEERSSARGMNGTIKTIENITLVIPYLEEVNTIEFKDPQNNSLKEFSLKQNAILTPGQRIKLTFVNPYKEIYLYNEDKQKLDKITLDCKDFCSGKLSHLYTIPKWEEGNYFIMYNREGWRRFNFQISNTVKERIEELEIK